MPNSDGSSEKQKPWTREIIQAEWDEIFPPEKKFCSGCGLRLNECNEECHDEADQ